MSLVANGIVSLKYKNVKYMYCGGGYDYEDLHAKRRVAFIQICFFHIENLAEIPRGDDAKDASGHAAVGAEMAPSD
jgi:hypothetical protein